MLLQRLKIALRLMNRQRFFTVLNLVGLAIGSACFLLISAYVYDELQYDQFHAEKDRLYRVNMTNIWIENNDIWGSTSPGVAKAIRNDIPEIESVVRVHIPYFGNKLVRITDAVGNTKNYEEDWILAAGAEFFDIFTFPMKKGDAGTALSNPNSVVLTEQYAEKYFGDSDPLGKSIQIGIGDDQQIFQVTGVIENVPSNAHFDFNFLVSLSSYQDVMNRDGSWIWTNFVTYALLDPKAEASAVEEKLKQLPAKYVGEEKAAEKNWMLYLQKVTDIHLYSQGIPNRLGSGGNIKNVYIFSTVAVLILLLSCVNFMNLATARYAERAKEVGIHKVLGSKISQIRAQFLIESLLFSFISVVIGFGLAEISKGGFTAVSGKSISLNMFENPIILPVMLGLILIIGLLSGTYPAWFLTRFKPVEVLKGRNKQVTGKAFRNSLVVFQFTISIALLGGSFLVRDQLGYLANKSLGFDDDNIIVLHHMEWMDDKGDLFKNELLNTGTFTSITKTNAAPPRIWNQDNFEPQNSDLDAFAMSIMVADPDLPNTLGLELVAGRQFFPEGEGDNQSILINESTAYKIGWLKPGDDPSKVLGNKMNFYSPENVYTVVGVVKDFNFWQLSMQVEPLGIFHPNARVFHGERRYLLAKLNTADMESTMEAINKVESKWYEINPNLPFEYSFLDQDFDSAFTEEKRFGQVIDIFSALAIVIAILGLVGLISFTTEQRTKEFSVRKVLGATTVNLIRMIAVDFSKLLAIGFAIGSALCWYYGNEWLSNFNYRIGMPTYIFGVSGGTLLILILIITTFIIQKNASRNPAETLRDE